MKTAYIMIGAPGSGKDHWLHHNVPGGALVSSADDFFTDNDGKYHFDAFKLGEAHQSCLRDFIYACRMQFSAVAVSNTNTRLVEVAPYIAVAQAFGYDVRVIFCYASVEECAKRNQHGVSLGAIAAMKLRIDHMLAYKWPPYWPKVEAFFTGSED